VRNQKTNGAVTSSRFRRRHLNRATCLMLAVAPVVAAAMPGITLGATETWNATGVSSSWLNAANWNTAVSAGDSLLFSTSSNVTSNDDFAAGTRFGSITFDGSAPAYSLTGSNSLVLGDSAFPYPFSSDPNLYVIDLTAYNSLVNSSTNLQTISIPITLSTLDATHATGGFHIINGGTGGIALNGSFTRPFSATADFQGTVTSTTIANNPSTGIIGGWATYTTAMPGAVDFAAKNGSTIGPFTGYTLASTTIASAANSVVQLNATAASVTLTAAGITDIDSLNFINPELHTITMTAGQQLRMGVTGTIMRSDNTTVTTSGLTITGGNITAGGPTTGTPGELILNANGNAASTTSVENVNTMLITSPIVDNGVGGKVSIIKTGLSSVQLNGANTFTGDIYLDEGRLRAGNLGAFGAAQNIYVSNGSQLYWGTANMNSTANIFLAGFGEEENATFVGGAMRLASANVTLAGTITLTDDAMITQRGSGTGGSFITGQITGSHALKLGGGGCGTLFLSNTNNNWTGNTLIYSGTTKLNASEVIPNGAGKGDVYLNGDMGGANVTVFDLNGKNETINGLNTTILTSVPIVTSSGAGSATLTIGDNNASGNYSGNITDSGVGKTLSIVKIGTGTETLNANTSYVGNTTITGGTLALANSGAITNSAVITVGPSGKLDVSALSPYNMSPTTTQALVNNGTVAGDIIANAGAVISGTSPYGNVTLNSSTASVHPGASAADGVVGTTTFGNLTVNAGDERVDLSGVGDKIVVTNTLNIVGAFTITPTPNPVAGTYTIISAGTINGVANITVSNSGRTTFNLDESVPTLVKLIVAGNPANLRWDNSSGGGDGSSWDTTNLNWFSTAASNPFQYFDGDNVTFSDTNSSHYTVNISGTVSPGSVVVSNSLGDYVIGGGSINGTASLTKSGSRALTLNGANGYTGGTIFSNGTLNLGNASAIGTGSFSIGGGTTLDNTSGSAITFTSNNPLSIGGSFTFPGAVDTSHDLNFGTGAVTLTGSPTITISGAGTTLTIGGVITGGVNSMTLAGLGTLVLSNGNSFSGGLTVNGGTIRASNAGAAGTSLITVNSTGSYITTGTPTNNIVLAGGTLYPSSGNTTFAGNVTLSPSTVSTFISGDPAANTVSLNGNVTGILHGSGTLNVQQSAGVTTTPDGSQGFRVVGTVASDFSGIINVANNAKFELASSTVGSFPVAGTGKIVVTPGTVALGNTLNGSYLEFNIRNNSAGNTTFGNNVDFAPGAGTVIFNALGTAPVGALVTMGNLKIGDQQQLGIYLGSGNTHNLAFTSVTLNGGLATFSPFLPGFGAATAVGSDLSLGNITELVAGSGIAMSGSRTLFLTGTNTFSGGLAVNSGNVVLSSPTPTVTKTGGLTIAGTYGGSASAVSTYTAALDLTINKLIVEDTSGTRAADIAQIQNEALTSNTNSGTVGIFSSTANATNVAAGKIVKVVAVSDNAVRIATFPAGSTNFGGTNNVDAHSILVAAVFKGDANMDGVVDIQDLTDVANHWQQSVTDWSQGDFDGSDFVDIQDLTAVANNWQAGVGAGGGSSFSDALAQIGGFKPSTVPEPASLALLGLGGVLVTSRRRHRA